MQNEKLETDSMGNEIITIEALKFMARELEDVAFLAFSHNVSVSYKLSFTVIDPPNKFKGWIARLLWKLWVKSVGIKMVKEERLFIPYETNPKEHAE